MIDIKFLRENPDAVRENIKKKFQDSKLPLVDEVIELDVEKRQTQQKADSLRASRNKLSKQIGALMGQGKRDEAEQVKAQVKAQSDELLAAEAKEKELDERILKIMMTIPNIIDPSVPIGRDDSENVEVQRYGEPVTPDFPVPYHTEIMERFNGIDLDAARRVAGNGFYYLMGDIARLHSAVIAYARDFMIDRGFTYVIPPYMIRSDVVTGVMSFAEMDSMMYKIEGEDLYLVGTSEHSMIGKFIDQILPEAELPLTLTSYSPCFRKEKGAHGIDPPVREAGDDRRLQARGLDDVVRQALEEHGRPVPQHGHPGAHARVLLGRPRGPQGQVGRRRGLVAAPAEVLRGRQLLEPRRRTGAPPAHPRQRPGRQVPRAHAEQHGRRPAAHADRVPREQPAGRRQRPHPRGAAPVHGRQGRHRPEEVNKQRPPKPGAKPPVRRPFCAQIRAARGAPNAVFRFFRTPM